MNDQSRYIRQPIVSVLGHVDHGKTSLLDYIRGSTVALRESGAITQHIGATEVPIDAIYRICGKLLHNKTFIVPGLLFIDTPGHHAFTTLRSRGGSLADIAVLVIDIQEGFRPQTYESLTILRQYKTPFVVAVNKIDAISGWRKQDSFGKERIESQSHLAKNLFDEKIYDIVGALYDNGFSSDLYYNISDFRKTVALVPLSAKTGEGVPELLMVLIGLAQRFLEHELIIENGPGKGTVLEVKETPGLGTTIDAIIYNGSIKKDDTIVVGTNDTPIVTRIKALLKPKPMDEIRDPRDRFDSVYEAHAACGIKISAPNLDQVIPGASLQVLSDPQSSSAIIEEIAKQSKIQIELDSSGVIIKADTIGSLEALVKESKEKGIMIRKAEIGHVSKRDIIEASSATNPLERVIFAFTVKILPEAREEMMNTDVMVFQYDVIYTIIEKYEEWVTKKKIELENQRRQQYTHPGIVKFLPQYVFRMSHPAIIGVRVLAGRIQTGMKLMRDDGRVIGSIKGIQSENKSIPEALQGQEVAISIEGAVVGRHIKGDDILYTDIPENDAKILREMQDLNPDERDALEKIISIKRKQDKFWGI
jgi:translation initiation factor 5B